jgi:hypothetical protein
MLTVFVKSFRARIFEDEAESTRHGAAFRRQDLHEMLCPSSIQRAQTTHDADLVSVDMTIRVAGKAALSRQRLAGYAVVVPVQVEGIGGVGIQACLCLSLGIEVGAVAVSGCAGTTSRLK